MVFTGDTLAGNIESTGQCDEIGVIRKIGFAITSIKKQLLPLSNHTQSLVIQQHDFQRQLFSFYRAQLLNIHHKRAVTRDTDNHIIWAGHLCTNSSGYAKAHGAQTTRGDEILRAGKVHMLRRPHLVLPHVGGDYRLWRFAIRNLLKQ
ncbi:Uncharacterised protein [Yersinia enterocolitica]|nr:Uncharacterised protein [Yersinia enterocolitica]